MNDEQLKEYKREPPILTDEQIEALRRLGETLVEAWQEIRDRLADVVTTLSPALKKLAQYLAEQAVELEKCPNRRVVHLAKHSKKARTRKKNLHRAMRIMEKEANK